MAAIVSIMANRKRSFRVAGSGAAVVSFMSGLRATRHGGAHQAAPAATAYGSHTPDYRFQTETVRSTKPGTRGSTEQRATAARNTWREALLTGSQTRQASSGRSRT